MYDIITSPGRTCSRYNNIMYTLSKYYAHGDATVELRLARRLLTLKWRVHDRHEGRISSFEYILFLTLLQSYSTPTTTIIIYYFATVQVRWRRRRRRIVIIIINTYKAGAYQTTVIRVHCVCSSSHTRLIITIIIIIIIMCRYDSEVSVASQ